MQEGGLGAFTLDGGDGFMGVYIRQTLNLCSLLYINYTLIKWTLKEKSYH